MGANGIIEEANPAAHELFGYEPGELKGRKVNILMSGRDRDHHDEYLRRYQQTRVPHIIGIGREVTGRCKDGTEFPLRLAVSEVQLEGGTVYTGILHDLSEFRAAQQRVEELNRDLEQKVNNRTAKLAEREAELKHALSKERELNELKSRFLSMASHEFKTPLSTVLSSAELIELYTDTGQQPKRERHINRIRDAVNQLTDVLNDFLSLTQLEQGEIQVAPRPIDLIAHLSTGIEASEGQLKRGQQIVLEAPTEARPRIVTDPKLLRHVLMNLLSNAAKYSPEGSPVTVRLSTAPETVTIAVIDTGIGIPEEDQPHLFDRFFRANNVENIKGTGLGLNIVNHYVQLLGGSVTFTSTLREGTTFTVALPTELTP